MTGGAGYIGSVVARKLAEAGEDILIIDDLSTGSRRAVGSLPFEHVDICDAAALADVFTRHSPRAVMHLAAKLDVGESVREPLAYYRTNVTGTLNLLEAMRAHGTKHIVFSSSASVYGTPNTNEPLTEDMPMAPISPYGRTKAMGEEILKDESVADGMQYVSLRYFNVAGKDLDTPQGDNPHPKSNLIPAIARSMKEGAPIKIFGDDFDTKDGTGVRDYVHVSDLADAHLLALAYLEKGGKSGTFNLGNGTGFTVKEAVSMVGEVTGVDPEIMITPRREGDPAFSVANPTRAMQAFGWKPTRSNLREIVETGLREA